MVSAIVPAYNEEATVGTVVRTLVSSGLSVLVVDDGSSDRTAERAHQAGAQVVRPPRNLGKAGAMLAGLSQVPSDPVAFFDADLMGLRPDHVARLLEASARGYDMACGLRDYGSAGNAAQLVLPLITGERIVRRWVLERVPRDCWDGYAIETAMNHAVSQGGGRTALLRLDGLHIRTKLDKTGWLRGTLGQLKMFSTIHRVDGCLDDHGTCSL